MQCQIFDKCKEKRQTAKKMEEFLKPYKEQLELLDRFRERVMAECNVSRQTYYNWTTGKSIEAKYKPIINRIAMEIYGCEVFLDKK